MAANKRVGIDGFVYAFAVISNFQRHKSSASVMQVSIHSLQRHDAATHFIHCFPPLGRIPFSSSDNRSHRSHLLHCVKACTACWC